MKNQLLMYLLQCRSKDFISCFERVGNRCYTGIVNLYYYNYANRLLLDSDDWNSDFLPVVEYCRKGCNEIDYFLRSLVEIPDDIESSFKELMTSSFQYYDEVDDFEWMLDGDLDTLIQIGYKEIDCYFLTLT